MAPYNFRICCALPGGPVIELFRSHHTYASSYFNAATRDLSSDWDCWVESRMPDRRALGGRVKIYDPSRNGIRFKATSTGADMATTPEAAPC